MGGQTVSDMVTSSNVKILKFFVKIKLVSLFKLDDSKKEIFQKFLVGKNRSRIFTNFHAKMNQILKSASKSIFD